jgi:hypothetical protein
MSIKFSETPLEFRTKRCSQCINLILTDTISILSFRVTISRRGAFQFVYGSARCDTVSTASCAVLLATAIGRHGGVIMYVKPCLCRDALQFGLVAADTSGALVAGMLRTSGTWLISARLSPFYRVSALNTHETDTLHGTHVCFSPAGGVHVKPDDIDISGSIAVM